MYQRIFIILLSFTLLNCSNKKKDAVWITCSEKHDTTNAWICFRKTLEIKKLPEKAPAKIAVDSKYWLWINDSLVIWEGGLKRGPNPNDTYCDEIDLLPYLKQGSNTIALLLWYFGKDGFSHKNSGKAGLYFNCMLDKNQIVSDSTWRSIVHPAFFQTKPPHPNFRLPESNIGYNAKNEITNWKYEGYNDRKWGNSIESGSPPVAPWNNLVTRPIPFWKDYGLKSYVKTWQQGDTLYAKLPYNAQVTPYLKVKANAGETIQILSDVYLLGKSKVPSVRTDYITKEGEQEFETFGWMNGHIIKYILPKECRVLDVKYRETGYDTQFAGSFYCDDLFLNKLWKKAARTLYVNMRDNYFDCPERERAQWWGDVIIELGQGFYCLDTNHIKLTRKAIHELINWQRKDSTLFSPVPAGNWNKELPQQMLASVGYYGIWTYYLFTGDTTTLNMAYPAIKKYLALYKLDSLNLLQHRAGDWDWSDWGKNIDVKLLDNMWYLLACRGMKEMAKVKKNKEDVKFYDSQSKIIRDALNQHCWTGNAYRSPKYKGITDDRGNALAYMAQVVNNRKYDELGDVLYDYRHASPYMEKYVLESNFRLWNIERGTQRMKQRYQKMVNAEWSTLWETWEFETPGKNTGTYNHAWAGGPLIVMSKFIAGIEITKPAVNEVMIRPRTSYFDTIYCKLQTIKGELSVATGKSSKKVKYHLLIPDGTRALMGISKKTGDFDQIRVNNEFILHKGKFMSSNDGKVRYKSDNNDFIYYYLLGGEYLFDVLFQKQF
jgi:alpha-L-rhamnosidase